MATAVNYLEQPNSAITHTAFVTWSDGTQSMLPTVAAIADALPAERLDRIMSIRIESKIGDGLSTVVVARGKVPGVQVEVVGSDAGRALGTAEIMFQRMMVGYVDRMGGLRPLIWMSLALAPMILVSWAVAVQDTTQPARMTLMALAAAAGLATFHIGGPKLLYSDPLALLDRAPERVVDRWKVHLLAVYRHRHTKAILGVVGVLLLGIVGNKISELIPFP